MKGIISAADVAGQTLVKLTGFNLGFIVGKSKSVLDDQMIQNSYDLARTGQLSPDAVNQAIAAVKTDNPILAGNLIIILTAMGGIAQGGLVVNLGAIAPELWDAAHAGFITGQAMGIAAQ